MRYIKTMTALILTVAIMLAGCSSNGAAWAFKSGDTEIPVGLYMLYQLDAFYDANEQIQIEETGDASQTPQLDPAAILKKTVEGKKASDWIAEKAQAKVREHIALKDKFQELGLEMTETETTSVTRSAASASSQTNQAFFTDNGISEKSMEEYFTSVVQRYRIFNALYEEGGSKAVAESELKDYFKTNYAMIDLMILYKLAAYGVTAEEFGKTDEEIKTAAEGYLTRLKAGEEIEQLQYEWELETAADEETKNLIQRPEEGSIAMIISEHDRASFGDELMDAFMGLKVGQPQLIDDPECYLVAERVDIMANESVFLSYKVSILQELKSKEYIEEVAAWGTQKQVEINNTAINSYGPEKINFKNLNA